ncbi:hypothetical protein OIV83_000625 [Microbotryomycetes sp. JL201]|nr:hypothetical protein OIV83_000625 [Microbotryomycetes sp. JL201]
MSAHSRARAHPEYNGRQGIMSDLNEEYWVVVLGGFSSSESICRVESPLNQMAVAVNAVAVGRFKRSPRQCYMLFRTAWHAWQVIANYHQATRKARDGTLIEIVASFGGTSTAYLRGADALRAGKSVKNLCFFDPPVINRITFDSPSSFVCTQHSYIQVPTFEELSVARMLMTGGPTKNASARHVSQPSESNPQQAVERSQPHAKIDGSFIPDAPVVPLCPEMVTQVPLQPHSIPVDRRFGHIVWFTANEFFHFFQHGSNTDRRFLFVFDGAIAKIRDCSLSELIDKLEAALQVGPTVMQVLGPAFGKEVITYHAYRESGLVDRVNLLVGFGDAGETRAKLLLGNKEMTKRLDAAFRTESRAASRRDEVRQPDQPQRLRSFKPIDGGWSAFERGVDRSFTVDDQKPAGAQSTSVERV